MRLGRGPRGGGAGTARVPVTGACRRRACATVRCRASRGQPLRAPRQGTVREGVGERRRRAGGVREAGRAPAWLGSATASWRTCMHTRLSEGLACRSLASGARRNEQPQPRQHNRARPRVGSPSRAVLRPESKAARRYDDAGHPSGLSMSSVAIQVAGHSHELFMPTESRTHMADHSHELFMPSESKTRIATADRP